MKITRIIAAVGVVATLATGTAATARDHDTYRRTVVQHHDNGNHYARGHHRRNGRHCTVQWRHHHRITVCR